MNVTNEIKGRSHSGADFPWDTEAGSTAKADSDENGIVFGEQFIGMEILADIDACLDFDPERLHQPDFIEAHLGLHFVISDTACIQPARQRLLLKNHNPVPQRGEVRRTAETSRASPNDRYTETVGFGWRVQN